MPCCDPIPTYREERASECLKLIVGIRDSGENIKYPIGFNGDIGAYSEFGSDKYLNEATQILCSFCREKGEAYIYDGRLKERRRLADWWDDHKEIDRHEGRL
jgi:hypothetical protein